MITPNKLQREFTADNPDRARVTDIIYIRTRQGRLDSKMLPVVSAATSRCAGKEKKIALVG